MNYYLRYFDDEVLVHSVDEALDFLCSLREIDVTPIMEQEVRDYLLSDVRYPKRYKVRAHVYFIIIKTDARDMDEFKSRRGKEAAATVQQPAAPLLPDLPARQPVARAGQTAMQQLQRHCPGWYEGALDFKRVTTDPATGKFMYRDTRFVARLKADSPYDCYQRLVNHLQQRVDQRSQFPSVKGKNYQYKYLGAAK